MAGSAVQGAEAARAFAAPAAATSARCQARVPAIDGLRTLAVLSVLAFHFRAAALPGGFSGVDVFFVISGYVVAGSLARHLDESFRGFLLGFYARRLLRIYPALVACLLASAVLQDLFVPAAWLSASSNKTGLLAFFGLSNFGLIWLDDGYFSPRVEFNLFTHTWSLGVEEQFYVLFPFILWAWERADRLSGVRSAIARWSLPALGLASLAACAVQSGSDPQRAYYLLPSRFWELAAGALLFQAQARGHLLASRAGERTACLVTGMLLLVVGFVRSDPSAFPFPWALIAVLGSVLVLAGATSAGRDRSGLARVLAGVPLVYIGRLSYSMYLWHWPILAVLRWTTGTDSMAKLAAGAVLTFAAAALSYHVIERPAQSLGRAKSHGDGWMVARGALGISVAAAVALGIFLSQRFVSLSVTRDRMQWYPLAWSAGAVSPRPAWRGRRLWILGDSHAEAVSTAAQMLRDREGVQVTVLSQPGCAVAGLLEPEESKCVPGTRAALHTVLAQGHPGDVVFLSSLRMVRLETDRPAFDAPMAGTAPPQPTASQRAAALHEADAVVRSLEGAGLNVLIDAPLPVFPTSAFRCSDWFNRRNPGCSAGSTVARAVLEARRAPVMASLATLAQKHPRVLTWDPFPRLCPGQVCDAYDGGHRRAPLFFDGDHLSAHGNRVLYPDLLARLATVWGPASEAPDPKPAG